MKRKRRPLTVSHLKALAVIQRRTALGQGTLVQDIATEIQSIPQNARAVLRTLERRGLVCHEQQQGVIGGWCKHIGTYSVYYATEKGMQHEE